MDKSRDVNEWHRRAKASLARAKMPISGDMIYEDACFDCQQSAEKALKGLIIKLGLVPDRTHNIRSLLSEIEKRTTIPKEIYQAITLNQFAVTTRYPDDYYEISEEEYLNAVKISEMVLKWVSESIK